MVGKKILSSLEGAYYISSNPTSPEWSTLSPFSLKNPGSTPPYKESESWEAATPRTGVAGDETKGGQE